jgi:Protein of unknown function (DUF1579)
MYNRIRTGATAMKNLRMPRRVHWALLILLALSQSTPAAGRQGQGSTSNDRRSEASSSDESSSRVERLAKMVAGNWTVRVTSEPSSEKPKHRNETGTSRIHYGPGNLSLIEDYRTEGDSGPRQALGVFWWDATAQGYRSMFCDNLDPGGCSLYDGVGKWEGSELVFHFVFRDKNKQIQMREVLTRTSANSFTARFYTKEKSGEELLRTVEHTRSELP